jgi:ERCC4-type nuclease
MISIDSREKDLIKIFEFLNHPINTSSLHLGDALIDNIIIEPKSTS